jgi:hypothetical protein
MADKQLALCIDTAQRRRGRAERGPTARKRWRELQALTRLEAARADDWSAFWLRLVRTGVQRRWWTLTDVRCLARPLGGVPKLRDMPEPERKARAPLTPAGSPESPAPNTDS